MHASLKVGNYGCYSGPVMLQVYMCTMRLKVLLQKVLHSAHGDQVPQVPGMSTCAARMDKGSMPDIPSTIC
jgi:hypothetical protein